MLLPMMISSIGMLIVSTLLCRRAWADEPTEIKSIATALPGKIANL